MTDTFPVATHITIDYGMLNDAVTDLKALSTDVGHLTPVGTHRGSNLPTANGYVYNDPLHVGHGDFGLALATFYMNWATPMGDAADWIKKLESIFQNTADAFMQADAEQAGAINEGAAISAVIAYPAMMDAYYKALDNYWTYDPYTQSTVGANGAPDPQPPIPPDNPYSLAPGVTTSYDNGVVDAHPQTPNYSWPQKLPTTETTTVNSGGMTYSETTTFGPDKGWGPDGPTQDTVQVVHNPDGSTDTFTTTLNLDGSGTMTDVNVSGTITTTTDYSRSTWHQEWADVTPVTDQGNSVNSDPGPDLGAPMVN